MHWWKKSVWQCWPTQFHVHNLVLRCLQCQGCQSWWRVDWRGPPANAQPSNQTEEFLPEFHHLSRICREKLPTRHILPAFHWASLYPATWNFYFMESFGVAYGSLYKGRKVKNCQKLACSQEYFCRPQSGQGGWCVVQEGFPWWSRMSVLGELNQLNPQTQPLTPPPAQYGIVSLMPHHTNWGWCHHHHHRQK